MKKLIVLAGPTASGKSALALALAKEFDGEIISADSMQIYKGMDIATAKPSEYDMQMVKHHMVGFLSPSVSYSAADFIRDAKFIINDVESRGKLPILAGGTGLYIDLLTESVVLPDFEISQKTKKIVQKFFDENIAFEKLLEVDSKTAEITPVQNKKRIRRALEVFFEKGKPISYFKEHSKDGEKEFDCLYIVLAFNDRQLLYDRINKRVDKMLELGLVDEAKDYYNNPYKTSSGAIGYKELAPFFKGEKSLESCVDALKQATRRYAKRQLIWFKRKENAIWLYVDEYGNEQALFEKLKEHVIDFVGNNEEKKCEKN